VDDHPLVREWLTTLILERFRQLLPALLAANMFLLFQMVGSRAGHDDLHYAFVIVVMPVRAKFLNRLVKLYANAAAHANYHRVAFHRRVTRIPNAAPSPRPRARSACPFRPLLPTAPTSAAVLLDATLHQILPSSPGFDAAGTACLHPPSCDFGATRRRIVNLSGALTKFMRANIVRA
jgi:hypothetical protein